jgi:hypothetical protein
VDSWIWSVRLTKTRLAASGACRAGHVRVNGVRVKPARPVRAAHPVRGSGALDAHHGSFGKIEFEKCRVGSLATA